MNSAIRMMIMAAILAAPGRAPGAQADKSKRDVAMLLAGMRDARERLRSGIYRARGRLVNNSSSLGPYEGDCVLYCAFDDDKHWFRFDRQQPWLIWDTENLGMPDGTKTGPGILRTMTGKFARTPEREVYWDSDSPDVTVSAPTAARVTGWVCPIDIRTVGLLTWNWYLTNDSFAASYASLTSSRVVSVVAEGTSVYHVAWLVGDDETMKRDVWIDVTQGYSPTRMELRLKDHKAPQSEWPQPQVVSETTWSKVADVWVPATLSLDDHTNSNGVVRQQLQFEWESVNAPISEDLFKPEGFDLNRGILLVDRQLGKPIITGMIGDPDFVPPVAASEPDGAARQSLWLWGAIVLSFVLGTAWYLRRRVSH